MIEIVIFGRGGQGGVTLAKLLAGAWFHQGKHVQAFGVYAAERSGAPLNAFVRADDREIDNRNQIYQPDHVIVLDRSLLGERTVAGLKPGGWLLLNTPEPPDRFAGDFPGFRIATVDATEIAVAERLGTRTTPIVNSTLLGAAARILGLPRSAVEAALAEHGFGGPNLSASRAAWDAVRTGGAPEAALRRAAPAAPAPRPTSLLAPGIGGPPRIQTGTWATQQPRRHEWTAPCSDGCPAGNDVRGFLAAVKDHDLDRALAILHRTSPFPAICGRVCPAHCMDGCHRQGLDQAVNVSELERYVGDHARPEPVTAPPRAESVGVVGSGPAGLSAAYQLGRLGYPVTLYEAGDELGGVMRTGIPAYRLPREVLDREIDFVLQNGVQARCGERIDRPRLRQLTTSHAAVFVATGLQEARTLSLGLDPGSDAVQQGITFLDDARRGALRLDRLRVVVIGGGNTAIDAARTALRLGAASVTVLYRRTRAEMPAIAAEIDEALEEGVVLRELVAPLRIEPVDGQLALACQRMQLGEPDASGRRQAVPIEGGDGVTSFACDRVILALGQGGDLSVLPEGAEVTAGQPRLGLVEAPVFVGGDLSGAEGTVAAAIASGRTAAWHIHRTLTGEDLFPAPPLPLVPRSEVKLGRFTREAQRHGGRQPAELRVAQPALEVRTGIDHAPGDAVAVEEAGRCLHCGGCNHCDLCRESCPEGVLLRQADSYSFRYDHCKGCGLCANECPRGVVFMESV